jgi:hypothetical protein
MSSHVPPLDVPRPSLISVAQYGALASDGLRYEHAGGGLGPDEPRWMELHQFGVADPGTGVERQTERIASALVATRGAVAPDPGVAAGGEDDGIGVDHITRPVVEIKPVRAEDDSVAYEQPGDVGGVDDRDVEPGGTIRQRPLNLETRVVAGERGTPERVGAKEPLGNASVGLPREGKTIVEEVLNPTRSHALLPP